MKVISVIEDEDIVKKILKHLGLWEVNPPEVWRVKPRPVANAPPSDLFPAYDEQPGPCVDDYLTDPNYPAEAYF